jgi:hypothetical protein
MGMNRNVRNIHHDWVNAGAHVQETVAALSQQLRRYVDENFLEEERRINKIVREIEGKAVSIRNNPPKEWELVINGIQPEIFLPLDRPLFSPPQRPEIKDEAIDAGEEDVPADAIFSQVYVDKEKLKDRIGYMLQTQDKIELSQIIEHYPLDLGLSELITYLVIASETPRATFYPDDLTEVSWNDEEGKRRMAKMAKIIFQRS